MKSWKSDYFSSYNRSPGPGSTDGDLALHGTECRFPPNAIQSICLESKAKWIADCCLRDDFLQKILSSFLEEGREMQNTNEVFGWRVMTGKGRSLSGRGHCWQNLSKVLTYSVGLTDSWTKSWEDFKAVFDDLSWKLYCPENFKSSSV